MEATESLTVTAAESPRSSSTDGELRRALQRRHMQMIAFGGAIGAGLFVGSGVVIRSAGPAAILSFLLTGTLVVLVMRMLGEMATAYPGLGGFYEYNRLGLGRLAGFLTGWMYWYFWVIVVAMEAVAGAKLLQFWLPAVPAWTLTLGIVMLFTVLNLFSVRAWGEAEYWFSAIKIVAITAFLCLGAAFIAGFWPLPAPGAANLLHQGGFLPNGLGPVLAGAVTASGFYFGAELVTLAAAESAQPAQVVARTTTSVISRILVFYLGSILIVVTVLPWNDPGIATPYVSVLQRLRVPGAAHLMNAVILTAVLSALNCALYACSRIMRQMARNGDAPQALVRLNARGVPVWSILTATVFGYCAVVMSYVSPDRVFVFIVNSYGTVSIFVYLMIALAQLRLRARIEREDPARLRLKMWGYPWLTVASVIAIIVGVAAMAFIPDQRTAFWFGLVSVALMIGGYAARMKFGPPDPGVAAG